MLLPYIHHQSDAGLHFPAIFHRHRLLSDGAIDMIDTNKHRKLNENVSNFRRALSLFWDWYFVVHMYLSIAVKCMHRPKHFKTPYNCIRPHTSLSCFRPKIHGREIAKKRKKKKRDVETVD